MQYRMRKVRKGFVYLCAGLLTAMSLILVLGSIASAQEKAKIVVWEWLSMDWSPGLEILNRFEEEYPNIELQLEEMSHMGIYDKYVIAGKARQLPDVMMMVGQFTPDFAERGYLVDLAPYVEKEGGEEFLAQYALGMRKAGMWKGILYGIPGGSGPTSLFYNTDLFNKAGIASAPKTWEEFVEVAVGLTNVSDDVYGYTLAGTNGAEPLWEFSPWLYQAGGNCVDDQGNTIINNSAAVEALQFIVDLVNKYKVIPPGFVATTPKVSRDLFATGKIGMRIDGPWGYFIWPEETYPELKYQVALLPKGKTTGTNIGGNWYAISRDSKNKEAAWEFIKWFCGSEVRYDMSIRGYSILSSVKGAAERLKKEIPEHAVFYEQLEAENTNFPFGMPQPEMRARAFTIEYANAVMGLKTAKQALDDLAKWWEQL